MKRIYTICLSLISVFITVSIVIYPEIAFNAALKGLDIWFNIVFPALLPFFIGSQLLMGLGIVHFMGVLLEPFMRPFFNVPGTGSFVMAMGLASGYPAGAMMTAKLREQNLINKTEAERLISFTNTADPLFMFGAVAVGMFHNQSLGTVITASHYISCLILGLLLRFYKMNDKSSPPLSTTSQSKSIVVKAVNELFEARKKDGRALGQLLGDCIWESVNTLLLIGGFIILFSVITNILTVTGFFDLLIKPLQIILALFGYEEAFASAIISGTFEITMGSNLTSEVAAPLYQKVVIVSAIIAWSGLSVHAQVASLISKTDINLYIYLIARIIHAALAAVVSYFMMKPDIKNISYLAPVFVTSTSSDPLINWLFVFKSSLKFFCFTILCLSAISLVCNIIKKLFKTNQIQ